MKPRLWIFGAISFVYYYSVPSFNDSYPDSRPFSYLDLVFFGPWSHDHSIGRGEFHTKLSRGSSLSAASSMPVTSSSMDCHRSNQACMNHGAWSRPRTSYQLAHPAIHARHRWLKLRPQILLQLQQVSQSARSLPILDVLPSTVLTPSLSQSILRIFRRWNGLGQYDLVIVRSDLYDYPASTSEMSMSSVNEDKYQREVVATIRQPFRKEAQLKGKAEIFLALGSLCEATPLSSGSYEFLVRSKHGVQIMRWALRRSKARRLSVSSRSQGGTRHFTFSIIDPSSRRHAVIASMTQEHLEVYHEYSHGHRSSARPTYPNSGMSGSSDKFETESLDSQAVVVDDRLRILILVTGIWVTFREGWSHHFAYRDPVAKSHVTGPGSHMDSRSRSSTATISDDHTVVSEGDGIIRGPRRWASIALRVRRFNTTSPARWFKLCNNSIVGRSNSTRTV